jgi:hypothetical protein
MLIAIQPIVTNMFFGQPLDYGNPLHYEDMGSKISLFQQDLRRYEGCKVEVLKLGQLMTFLFLNVDDKWMRKFNANSVFNKKICGNLNVYH